MEDLKRKRSIIVNQLHVFQDYIKECQETLKTSSTLIELDIIEHKDRANEVESLNNEFEIVQSQIEEEIPLAELQAQYDERKKHSNAFHKTLSVSKLIIKDHERKNSDTDSQSGFKY